MEMCRFLWLLRFMERIHAGYVLVYNIVISEISDKKKVVKIQDYIFNVFVMEVLRLQEQNENEVL